MTDAIVHWITVYLNLAVQHLRTQGVNVSDRLLAQVAPLGWGHIALTGDYVWSPADTLETFRPLHEFAACSNPRPLSFEQIVRHPLIWL